MSQERRGSGSRQGRRTGEKAFKAHLVLADVGVNLAVGPFQVSVGDQGRSTVPGPAEIEHIEVVALDDSVKVNVEQVLARRRFPVAQQARLDMLELQRFFQLGVVHQVDLTDR